MPLKFHSRFSFRFIIQYVLARRHCTESTHGRSFNIHWNIQHFWDSSWTCPSVPCDRGKNRGEWRRGHNSDNWQFVGHLKVLSRWILAMATQSNQFGVDGCPKIHRLDEYWIELNIVELTKVVTNETRTSYMWFWKVRYFDTSSNSDGLVAVLWFLFNVHASRFAICPSWGFWNITSTHRLKGNIHRTFCTGETHLPRRLENRFLEVKEIVERKSVVPVEKKPAALKHASCAISSQKKLKNHKNTHVFVISNSKTHLDNRYIKATNRNSQSPHWNGHSFESLWS